MAIRKVEHVNLPYAGRRTSPDNSRLSALYSRGGEVLADIALRKGENAARMYGQLAGLFTNFQETGRQKKATEAAMAIRADEREQDRKERKAEQDADRAARQAERDAAAKLMRYAKDEAEAKDLVMDTPVGPLSDTDPRTAMLRKAIAQFPALAGRFGTTERLPATPLAGEMVDAPPLLTRTPTGVEQRQIATDAATQAERDRAAAERKIDNDRADKNTQRMIDAQASTERHQREMERLAVNKANAAAAGYPGNWDATGDDFLKSLPAQDRDLVKKIASYDLDPSKTTSMRGNNRERMMAMVSHLNPAYDQSQFALRAPTRKAFTIGTQGQQINAINTAMGHLDQLTDVADQLQQGGFVPGNQAWNAVRTAFGSDRVTNFDTLKDALAGEVAGVLSKSGATVSGIQDAKTHISAANSPTQLAGYVRTLIPVLGSKLSAFDYQYKQAMGADDAFSPLSSESKRILEKHGFDPAHPTLTKHEPTTATPAAFIEAVDPQGIVHHAPAGTPLPAGWKVKP